MWEGGAVASGGGGIVITVDNKISDSIATCLLRRRNFSVIKIAVGLCAGSSVSFMGSGAYYSLSSMRSTGDITTELKTLRCALGVARSFHGSMVSGFIEDCHLKTAPGPYVSYGQCVGFSGLLGGTVRLGVSLVTANRCTEVRGYTSECLLGGTLSRDGSRDCILCSLARSRLDHALFPLKGCHGSRIHRVTRRGNFVGTGGRSDRSVYFIPSKGCDTFVRGCAKRGFPRNSFISGSNGGLNARGKVVECAINRHHNLNLTLPRSVCMYRGSIGGGEIILKFGRSLFSGRISIKSVMLDTYSSLRGPRRLDTGVHCGRGRRPTAMVRASGSGLGVVFSRPRETIAGNRTTIMCSKSAIVNNKAVL